MRNNRLEQAVADLDAGLVPVPREQEVFVDGGSYLQFGAEFLRHCVELCGLEPQDTVLDIGSGIGRITSGLSRYLDDRGRYIGIDPVTSGIEWCRKAYGDKPNFRFEWADLYNELYRPEGTVMATEYAFPVDTGTVDLVTVISVFAHLYEPEIAAYLSEIARVLKPDGRLLSTAYLFDGDTPAEGEGLHQQFNTSDPHNPHRWHVEGLPPLAAVCYSQSYFARLVEERTGRTPEIRKGLWQGGEGPAFQDMVLL